MSNRVELNNVGPSLIDPHLTDSIWPTYDHVESDQPLVVSSRTTFG